MIFKYSTALGRVVFNILHTCKTSVFPNCWGLCQERTISHFPLNPFLSLDHLRNAQESDRRSQCQLYSRFLEKG